MKIFSNTSRSIVVGISLALMAGGALAGKPEWAGGDKQKEHKEEKEHKEKAHKQSRSDNADKKHTKRGQENDSRKFSLALGFGDKERRTVREYYGNQSRKGNCPPGLAKKNNGCLPPGQAKKWQKGRPINEDSQYYDLPNELRIRLPVPPINHEYVRMAGDVLLVTVGTKIVVDAIEGIFN